jgi:hypothetical protein
MAVSKLNPVAGGLDITKLTLRQTITSTGSISYPAGVMQVYAVVIGGGGCGGLTGNGTPGGGGAGGVACGWTFPAPYAVIGAGGGNNQNGNPSMYGAIIAGGGNKGAPAQQQLPASAQEFIMDASPYFLGGPSGGSGQILAVNGSIGGGGSGAQNANTVGGKPNFLSSAGGVVGIYEAALGGVYAPPGAGSRGPLNGGVNGNTNGLSGSGGTGSANQTVNSTAGNGGPGYFAGGGGSCNSSGGSTFFFAGGTVDTRGSQRGGGGGAGAVSAGGSTTNLTGGAGGTGGGGGGSASADNGTAGVGGAGAVLLYY